MSRRLIVVAAVLMVLVGLVLCGGRRVEADGAREASLSAGARGFSGMVRGVVVGKHDNGTISLKVARILKVWQGNKAPKPESLVGETVRVGPRWDKGRGKKWHKVERHVRFLRKLAQGQELNLEIWNAEHSHFVVLELSGEQREWAAAGREREHADREHADREHADREHAEREGREHPEVGGRERDGAGEEGLPRSVRGFSGLTRGVVVRKLDGNAFLFKVGRVLRVWEGSKARSPESLVGRTVRVGPNWRKGERGKWHPVESHVRFARGVRSGQELNLELRNAERDAFVILELSEDQRADARHE